MTVDPVLFTDDELAWWAENDPAALAEAEQLMAAELADERQRVYPDQVFALLGYAPTPRQQEFHEATEYDVLYGGAAGGGKMLRLDEAVPTPSGWSTIGDLRPGDELFTEIGAVCHVVAVHPIDLRPESWRLTFDDGTEIDACSDHLWLTYDAAEMAALTRQDPEWRARRRAGRASRATGKRSAAFTAAITERNRQRPPATLPPPTGTVRTTKDIAASVHTLGGRANHAIPVAGVLDLPDVDLPLAPYLLGCWLGDGHTKAGAITSADPEIVDAFRDAGFVVKPYADITFGINGLVQILRPLGVFGDKHVPAAYLRASSAQRLALLQGLMDTDGTCNQNGSIEFTTTRRTLADAVQELAVSLGSKVRIREGRATLYGKDCGPKWTLKWTASYPAFRLPRKLDRQQQRPRRTTRFRYLVSVEPVDPSPMRCITVDNPSGLFLVSRAMVPTHNTKALLMDDLRDAMRYPGIRIGAFRRTFDELAESLLKELEQVQFAAVLGAQWNGSKHDLRFPNGSMIRYRYARTIEDASVRQGGEYQKLTVDERTLMAPGVVDVLSERLRSGRAEVPVIGVRSGSNPGGADHAGVKAKFIDATDRGAKHYTDEFGFTVRFIPAKVDDNPHVDAGYRARLDAIPDPARRKAMKDGDWDVFAGQFFSEWRHRLHVVEAFDVPSEWRRLAGLDYGYAAPWAVEWIAQDSDGRAWVYRELYARGVVEGEQAERVKAVERGDPPVRRFADPAMWAKTGSAPSPATAYAEAGVRLEKATNDRVPGWQRVHSFLSKLGPACQIHRAAGLEECPMLHVFDTCPDLIRTLPALPHDRKRVEDVDTTAEDHAPDALRYGLMSLTPPVVISVKSPVGVVPRGSRTAIGRARQAGRVATGAAAVTRGR